MEEQMKLKKLREQERRKDQEEKEKKRKAEEDKKVEAAKKQKQFDSNQRSQGSVIASESHSASDKEKPEKTEGKQNANLPLDAKDEEWKTMTEERCEQVLEVDPFDNHARFRLSQLLISEDRDLTVAERLVKSIMNKDSKFMRADCYELLGDIEFSEKNKRYAKAVEYYHKSNDLEANNINIYIKLGKALEKLREFDEAIAFLKKALRRDGNNFQAHYRLASCYNRNNMRQEGIDSLKRAHAANPTDVETMLKLSEIYLRDDSELAEAEKMIRELLAIDNTSPEANLNLGRVFEKKGKNDEALAQFKKGLELS